MQKHGTNPDFKKLVPAIAPVHSERDFKHLSSLMGPSDQANPKIEAGYTYIGQFIDHDITLTKHNITNGRTPFFDLDSLYGDGPKSNKHSHLYANTVSGEAIFIIGNTKNADGDLNRDKEFAALIPETRNDENIIIASIHLLFQKFHNKLIIEHGLSFKEAKTTVTWHYQSMIVNDFLVKIVGNGLIGNILKNGRKLYIPKDKKDIFMPTEFSGACYRFGHSMVREKYSFNDRFNNENSNDNLFFGFPGGRPSRGHQITKEWTIQGNGNSLKRFFDTSILSDLDADNLSGKIDTKLSSVLFNLEPEKRSNLKPEKRSKSNILALLNLITGQNIKLPNGQQTAAFFNKKGVAFKPLASAEIKIDGIDEKFLNNTPLWFYVLKESEVRSSGERLGILGGRIVAETFLGILELDGDSFFSNKKWPFTINGVKNKKASMLDIINFVDS